MLLILKYPFIDNLKNNKKALTQEEMLVAIGIIIKPISSKNKMLIEIFIKTEINEKGNKIDLKIKGYYHQF